MIHWDPLWENPDSNIPINIGIQIKNKIKLFIAYHTATLELLQQNIIYKLYSVNDVNILLLKNDIVFFVKVNYYEKAFKQVAGSTNYLTSRNSDIHQSFTC